MNEIILVITRLFPIILILFLGHWIKRTGFLGSDTIHGMTKLVLNITLPCVLFLSFSRAELEPNLLFLSAVVFATCLLTFAAGFFIRRLQKSDNPFYPSVFTAFLTGPVGFPLFIVYFGAENLYKLAIFDVGNSIFIFTVLSFFLSTVSCDMKSMIKRTRWEYLKNLAKSPLTTSIFLGIILSMTGLNLMMEKNSAVGSLLDTIELLGSATFPLTLLIVGYELPFDFKNLGKTISAVLLRLAMMLSIAFLINVWILDRWLGLDKVYQAALFTLFILPPPFIIPISIVGECDHKKYVLDFISLHLLMSLVAFVILIQTFLS